MSDTREPTQVSHSIKDRIRDIFSPKPKGSPSPPSTNSTILNISPPASLPSRIPIRKKRSFRDVTQDEQDKVHSRARVRQRVDSTSSVVTVRGISRKASSDSVKTINADVRDGDEGHGSGYAVKRPSLGTLNPGQAAPARAVLTRSTSHNRVQSWSEYRSREEEGARNVVPFPPKRSSTSKVSKTAVTESKATRALQNVTAASVTTTAATVDTGPMATSTMTTTTATSVAVSTPTRGHRKSHSLKSLPTSRSLASVLFGDEDNGPPEASSSFASAMATPVPARHHRLVSPPSSPSPTTLTPLSIPSRPTHTKPTESEPKTPEEELLKQVLEYVINETKDEDAEYEYGSFVFPSSSYSTAPSGLNTVVYPISPDSEDEYVLPEASLPEIPDDDEEEEEYEVRTLRRNSLPEFGGRVFSSRTISRSRLERFDVKLEPYYNHQALWDMEPTDVYAWQAMLCITDNQYHDHPEYPRPPVKTIDIQFHTVDESSSSPSSHHHYSVSYEGLVLPTHQPKLPSLDPQDGIGIEGRWIRCGGDGMSDSALLTPFRDHLRKPPFDEECEFPQRRLGYTPSWAARIFVPVPMELFKGRECRFFVMKAKLTFEDWDVARTVVHSGSVKVSVEHLRKQVVMDGRRASLDL